MNQVRHVRDACVSDARTPRVIAGPVADWSQPAVPSSQDL